MIKGSIFSGFSDDEYNELLRQLDHVAISLENDEILVSEGDEVEHFYIVTKGRLKASRLFYSGNVNIIAFFHEGDCVFLDIANTSLKTSPYDVRSIGKSELIGFRNLSVFDNNISEVFMKRLISAMLRELANDNIRKLFKMDVLYRKSLRERIAMFFSFMSEKSGSLRFEINMNRDEFAQYLGCNRSSLSHELSLMRQDGIINFRKGNIEITDKKKLMSIID